MSSTRRHWLSFGCLIVFVLFALASRVNKIHYGAFNYYDLLGDSSGTRNYLQMNDGSRVYGEMITWKSGLIFKDRIRIDDRTFRIDEVQGYQLKSVFYGRLRNRYIQRIVHGKINIYVDFSEVTETSTDHSGFTHMYSYTRTDHYSQRGYNGPMEVLSSQKDIAKLVEGCPLSEEMANKSNHQIRKAIRNNRSYLNDIFRIYNNGCKPLH